MEQKRAELIGFTAESYAQKSVNKLYILKSFYNSPNFNVKYFSDEVFDDFSDKELNELDEIFYSNFLTYFDSKNIDRIALLPEFINLLYLCDNNAAEFYGKSIISLTTLQARLFTQGCYFKNMISELRDKVTDEILQNPAELISLYDASKNMDKIMENNTPKTNDKDSFGGKFVFGASKEDMSRLGLEDSSPDPMMKALKEKGKLSKKDILALQGIKI